MKQTHTRRLRRAAIPMLAVTFVVAAGGAWAYQSDEAGANANPPGYVSEGQYGQGVLGSADQPKPESLDTGSSYGIHGDWPSYTPPLADGKGKAQVEAYCSVCHNTTYISMQPPLSAQQWDDTVHKMLNTFGAKQYIPENAVPQIIEYLQSHYTPDTIDQDTVTPEQVSQSGDSSAQAAGASSSAAGGSGDQASAAVAPAKSDGPGASVYNQNCAACHQADGKGIPGAFPPQAGHAPSVLAVEGGREYLAHVLLFGLTGSIDVDGTTYNGAMPPWADGLDDTQIADALNYVLTAWGNNQDLSADFKPYTAKEIAAERSKSLSASAVHDARSSLNLGADAGATAADSEQDKAAKASKPLKADVSLATAVPGPVYAALQNANAVENIASGKVYPDMGSAHYDSLSADGKQLLVSNIDTGAVYLLDTGSGQKLATFDVGEAAQGVKISPDGHYGLAAVPGPGEVALLDLEKHKLIKKIAVGKTPHNARFTADGKTAYVTLQGGGAIAVIDMATQTKSGEIPVEGMPTPHNLDLSPDGKRLWIRDFTGHVAVLEIATQKVLAHFDIGPSHGGIDVIPDSDYVATVAIGGREVTILNQKTLKKVTTIEVGQSPHGVRASADGRWLYVSVTADDKIAVIDMNTFKVVRDVATQGGFPFWVAVPGNA
ncbi:40-residue YVTN family beta-propeller repeat protein [Pseudomonas sp. MT-1]|uniref:Cytochrome c domain-containing protein n=2 Tax=Stutzerimonas stutzeri TaxID=316 RepID=A0A172WPV0_STUST|nr:c-type cytochrome [Pseudomonas sp. 10B238]ANF25483.1 hypothetical protein PS273GM_10150 [Stutzerimonas stutzeri]BAP81480.1 40-residue YVTN family beta-propeller repeat protein [Pseudomonas sp. MT-1]